MKIFTTLSFLTLAHLSLADFYIFRVNSVSRRPHATPPPDYGYQIADVASPECDQKEKPWYPHLSDVSGKKLGVRCVGKGCNGGELSSDTVEMEMHFSNIPNYHWTIRSSQNFEMIGTDGKSGAKCEYGDWKDPVYECEGNPGKGRTDRGYRKFLCKTSISAHHIALAT